MPVLCGLFLAWLTPLLHAGLSCVVCQTNLEGSFYWMTSPLLPERQSVCQVCAKLKTTCFLCQLPVSTGGTKLNDGRYLCATHARQAVLQPQDAADVFLETKREMFHLLRGFGTLPNQNITLRLIDQKEMTRLSAELHSGLNAAHTVGLTSTRRDGAEFAHSICLLSGLTRAGCLAAGAHEYTHAWMNENVPADRKLDPDAVEGFCELMAYKMMTALHEDAEKQLILQNAYTRGQIDTFVEAEDTEHFQQVVHWVKSGLGERIRSGSPGRRLNAPPPERALAHGWPTILPTPVPDTLQLRGVSGRPGRRLALINNESLRPGDLARVRVGASSVIVCCLAVETNSAVIELVGTGERRTLRLGER